MKKIITYTAGFLTVAILFSTCYYFSYKSALNEFNQRSADPGSDIIITAQELTKQQEGEQPAIEADRSQKDTVSPSTQIEMETYDVITGTTSRDQVSAPDYLIGLDREGIIKYLNQYMQEVPLEEYQKGLLSYELVSFSDNNVVLKKTYNSDSIRYKYCIIVRDNMVVVYYSDKKTVYEYTGITASDLPEEEQKRLNYGLFIKDDEELYGILENYSS